MEHAITNHREDPLCVGVVADLSQGSTNAIGRIDIAVMLPQQHAVQIQRPLCILVCLLCVLRLQCRTSCSGFIALQCKEHYACIDVATMLPQQHAVQVQRPFRILFCVSVS